MKTFDFIRHGQSAANTGAKSMLDLEIPLTLTGVQQAQDLLKKLSVSPSKIYCSELLRAKQTAQVFFDFYKTIPENLECLNEFRYLGFETVSGMDGEERGKIAKQYWENATIDYRDSNEVDSFQDFLGRVDFFLSKIHEFDDNSFFFGHGIWMALLAWRLLGCQIETTSDIQAFRQFQTALPMHNTVTYKLLVSENGIKQLQKIEVQ